MNDRIAPLNLNPGQASLVSLRDLLCENLVVPIFQRPFDWREKEIDDLIADLDGCEISLFLGLVVLHRDANGAYEIIDGQQRMVSLFLLLGAQGQLPSRLPVLRDDDNDFFRRLVKEEGYSHSAVPETLPQRLLKEAYDKFSSAPASLVAAALQATCIVYVAPMIAGATSLFERINMRGRDVSQFDLVKNRLIGWLASLDEEKRSPALKSIVNRYDKLYRILNPRMSAKCPLVREHDADRLLRVHWILFTRRAFASSDRVIDVIEMDRRDAGGKQGLDGYILNYVDSLIDVANLWIAIQDPDRLPQDASTALRSALYEFQRLNRLAELEPLMIAAMLRFGLGKETADFVRLCTISSFRDALTQRKGNKGRSRKWTMARAIYQGQLTDGTGAPINTPRDLAHHFFWKTMSWWSVQEGKTLDPSDEVVPTDCAVLSFHSSEFYQKFSKVLHYFFWEYGLALGNGRNSYIHGSKPVQANQFADDGFWEEFRRGWDIEHVFPRKPDSRATEAKGVSYKHLDGHLKAMQPWLNHIGNLTIVPRAENRGLLSNGDFASKRDAMLERGEVPFNELFRDAKYIGNQVDYPFWGQNNCRKRHQHLLAFADWRWGTEAVKNLGVGEYDERVDPASSYGLDEEDE